MNELYVACDM